MNRIIEFMGLPGSGKSTLTKILLKELRLRELPILTNEEAVTRCIKRRDDGIIRNLLKQLPFIVWEPVAGIRNALPELHEFASKNMAFMELLFNVLNRGTAQWEWRQSILYSFFNKKCPERQLMERFLASDERVLIEEGFAMGVNTLMGCLRPGTSCEKEIETYVRYMPPPSAAFYIDVEPSECIGRLRRRPELPLVWAACTDAELLQRLAFNRRCLDLAATELEKRNIPVCRVLNANGNEETSAKKVKHQGIEWFARMRMRNH